MMPESDLLLDTPTSDTPTLDTLTLEVLLSIDGQRITSMEELKSLLFDREVGEAVEVVIYRGGERYRLELILGEHKG